MSKHDELLLHVGRVGRTWWMVYGSAITAALLVFAGFWNGVLLWSGGQESLAFELDLVEDGLFNRSDSIASHVTVLLMLAQKSACYTRRTRTRARSLLHFEGSLILRTWPPKKPSAIFSISAFSLDFFSSLGRTCHLYYCAICLSSMNYTSACHFCFLPLIK